MNDVEYDKDGFCKFVFQSKYNFSQAMLPWQPKKAETVEKASCLWHVYFSSSLNHCHNIS